MNFPKRFAFAVVLATTFSNYAWADKSVTIADPYADDPSNSPWTMSMEPATTFSGRVVRGAATTIAGKDFKGFDAYAPYFPDRTEVVEGYGSTTVGAGCDGINLGGVIQGQLSQYQQMVEAFIQQAPTLAIMFLAYSQPTVKAVIDELNGVGQFGLDLSNLTCSGVRAMADKSAEEKIQASAEAQCTAEAGFKDPECMADDGIASNVTKLMKDTKKTVSDRAGSFLGKASDATGGLVKFKGGIDGNSVSSGGGSPGGIGGSGPTGAVGRSVSCANVKGDGLRAILLGASGMPCYDIENYAGLLPDYKISEEGVSGVMPRTLSLKTLANDMVNQYATWVASVAANPEAEFAESAAFKAIFNRTNVAITTAQHRKLNLLEKNNPVQSVLMTRNLAQLLMLKDLNAVVHGMEVAVLTGIQNQADDLLFPQLRREQFVHAIDALKAELRSLNEEISLDQQRADITG